MDGSRVPSRFRFGPCSTRIRRAAGGPLPALFWGCHVCKFAAGRGMLSRFSRSLTKYRSARPHNGALPPALQRRERSTECTACMRRPEQNRHCSARRCRSRSRCQISSALQHGLDEPLELFLVEPPSSVFTGFPWRSRMTVNGRPPSRFPAWRARSIASSSPDQHRVVDPHLRGIRPDLVSAWSMAMPTICSPFGPSLS